LRLGSEPGKNARSVAPSPRSMVLVAGDFVKTGGMDRANYALADYLSRGGERVELVTHRAAAELTARADVTLRRVPKPLGSYVLGDPLLDWQGRRACERGTAEGRVTLVNGGNCVAGAVNWIHYVHAAYSLEASLTPRAVRRRLYAVHARRQERRALGRAKLVIANSHATRRVLIDRLGVPAETAVVVYYGIDASAFAPADAQEAVEVRAQLGFAQRPTVAFVGALGDRRKGFDTVFAAWRALCRDSTWDADLVAIGAGSELTAWRERARDAGLGDRIRLLGFRQDVARVLSACDAFVAPTRYEAFGLGVAEAIAKGLPALVSASAGVAELYPDELRHLLIEDPESAHELSRKLLRWRANSEKERLDVRAFSERVRGRSWDDMAAAIVRLIAERLA
jgi:glycosyltransferase involved in cell wall biosynthesis